MSSSYFYREYKRGEAILTSNIGLYSSLEQKVSVTFIPERHPGLPEGMKNWWCYYSPVLDLPKNWWCYYGYTYTKLVKTGGAKAPPAPPVPAPLNIFIL